MRLANLCKFVLFIAFCLALFIYPALATDFYASPTGKATGDGSISNPWDLQTALNHPTSVKPGDTIYLRGGTYKGIFASKLTGTASAPIKVRSYSGEWAVLDGVNPTTTEILTVNGGYTWFMELEIVNSAMSRKVSSPSIVTWGDGISVHAPGTKIINTVIHDSGEGIGLWSDSPNSEVYGNLIYYNGYSWPDNTGHGHGIYTQNRQGTPVIKDNIIFENFNLGIKAGGTSSAYVDNYYIEGNTLFDSAVLTAGILSTGPERNFALWGGKQLAQNPQIINNYFYYQLQPKGGSTFTLGFGGTNAGTQNAVVTNNYMIGGTVDLLNVHPGLNFAQNTIYGESLVGFTQSKYPNNIYSKPASNAIFVRPNQYDTNRVHITIYNFQKLNTVNVDISSLGWPVGTQYELKNVQDYFNDVIKGTLSGTTISVPMTGRTVAQPIAWSAKPASTFPDFGVFVLIKTSLPVPPTPGQDTTPPVISNAQPVGVLPLGTAQATLSMATDESATCKYSTTANIVYASMQNTFATTGGTAHSTLVTGLTNGNAYIYYIKCQDTAGNANTNDFIISFSIASTSGDTTQPTVSITAPASGATVSGTVTISASASDDTGVVAVEFKFDNLEGGLEDTTAPYSVTRDTTTITNGLHTITAIARDAYGNTGQSSITITVSNAQQATTKSVHNFPSMDPGETYKAEVTNPDISIREFSISVREPQENVEIVITKLSAQPSVQPPKGEVFEYLDIVHENLDLSNIRSVIIRFTVSKSWLSSKGVAKEDIALQRYTPTGWQKFATRVSSESPTHVEYAVQVGGFSIYAITAEKSAAQPPAPPPTEEKAKSPLLLYAAIAIIIIIILAAAVFALRRR